MPVVRDDLGAAGDCGDGFDRGADVGLDGAAGADVKPVRNTPRFLGSPQGHEFGDIVAVDGEIVEWLARREAKGDDE